MRIVLAEEVTFFNKGAILSELESVPEGSILEIDVRNNKFLDPDIVEILEDYKDKARAREINISLISKSGNISNPDNYLRIFNLKKVS